MARKMDREALHFRGAPHRLVGSVSLGTGGLTTESLTTIPVKVSLARGLGEPLVLPPRVRAGDPSLAILKLRLPRTTPPGVYEGTADVGGRSVPVVLDVEARPRLRASPPSLSLQLAAGKAVTVEMDLMNLGNVTADIPARHGFCVFDGAGVDRAFYVALAEDPPPGEKRIDRLLDELAAHHGGLVRLDVAEGSGPLPPGDRRRLRLELRFSARLRPGRVYAGAWSLDNLGIPVRVNVANGTREEVR
jgi:hypothetical protein